MKKKFLFLFALIAAVMMSICVTAADYSAAIPNNYDVPFVATPPEIDGIIDSDYLRCSPIFIGDNDGRGSTTTANAYFVWDYDYLYVCLNVKDTTPCMEWGTNKNESGTGSGKGNAYHQDNYDGFMFSINMTDERGKIMSGDPGVASYSACVKNSAVSAYGGQASSYIDGTSRKVVTKIETDASGNQTGYIVEMRIPFGKQWQPYFTASETITVAFRLNDWDGATQLGHVYTRNTQTDLWSNAYEYDQMGPCSWDGLNLVFEGGSANGIVEDIVIDGKRDDAYDRTYTVSTENGDKNAYADTSMLWDSDYLYVYASVVDAGASDSDSYTFAVNFGSTNGVYTVTRAGRLTASGSHASTYAGAAAYVVATGVGYDVEIKIPMGNANPSENKTYSFTTKVVNFGVGESTSGGTVGTTSTYAPLVLSPKTYRVDFVENGQSKCYYMQQGVHFALPESSDESFVGWLLSDGTLRRSGEIVSVTGNMDFEAVSLDFKLDDGAAVNKKTSSGIRFTARVSSDSYDALDPWVSDIALSMMIVPTDYIEQAKTHVPSELQALGYTCAIIPVDAWNSALSDAGSYAYSASLINIRPENYTREFSAVGIIDITFSDGEVKTILTPYSSSLNSRSIYNIAITAYEDRDEAGQSQYSPSELKAIKNYVDNVASVRIKNGQVDYSIPAGLDVRYYEFEYVAIYENGILTLKSKDGFTFDVIAPVEINGIRVANPKITSNGVITVNTADNFDSIHVNQIGYKTNAVKRAIVVGGGEYFELVRASDKTVVYSGAIETGTEAIDELSGDLCRYADFTNYNVPGTYYLRVNQNDSNVSYEFDISGDPYEDVQRAMLKMLYYQRCGTDLTEEYAGTYAHAACHTYEKAYAYRTDVKTKTVGDQLLVDSVSKYIANEAMSGGWHEAGDMSKQTSSGFTACMSLMYAYTLFPDSFDDGEGADGDKLKMIPESGNGIPDVLDEVKYELDWLLKMQDNASGGVHFTAFPWTHPSTYGQPGEITNQKVLDMLVAQGKYSDYIRQAEFTTNTTYYVYPTCVESTALFAATMAQASRVYEPFDAEFAQKCLDAAIAAWDCIETETLWEYAEGYGWNLSSNYIEGYTALDYLNEGKSIPTSDSFFPKYGYGNMGLKQNSKFFIYDAAGEMFLTTGEAKYLNIFASLVEEASALQFAQMNNTAYVMIGIATSDKHNTQGVVPEALLETVQDKILAKAETIYDWYLDSEYEIPLEGIEAVEARSMRCNLRLMYNAMTLISAEQIDSSLDYRAPIENAFNYLLGQNAIDYCMISGFGEAGVSHFHHRQNWMYVDNLGLAPIPGYMPFGSDFTKNIHVTHNSGSGDTDHEGLLDRDTNHSGSADIYNPEYGLEPGLPYLKAYVDAFPYYRYNEIEVDTNTYPIFVAAYLRSNAGNSETVASDVHVNQIGYLTGQVKRAIVAGGGQEFYLIDEATGNVVYQGNVESGVRGVDKYSGDVVCYADFTDFNTPGTYRIYIPHGDVTSYSFEIGSDVYDAISYASLNSFYTQRCGETLLEELVGVNARTACHTYASDYFPINGSSRQVTGGWHDAGDCGCYTSVTALVVQLMLTQYQMMPDAYGDDTNIPEAGNGISDLLDEAKVGIDWLLLMQDTDGGVYHSRGNNGPAGLGHISEDRTMYYIWPKTLDATCSFVAAMADAYKVFKDIDAEYAEECKAAALLAETWLLENWDDETLNSRNIYLDGSKWYVREDGKGALAYMNNADTDGGMTEEYMAASLALYELTGKQDWHNKFKTAVSNKTTTTLWRLDYNNFSALTMYKYLTSGVATDAATVSEIESKLNTLKTNIISEFDSMPYRLANSGDKFGWGSNAELTGQLIALILIDDYYGGNGEYNDIIVESVDYILGKNPIDYSYITGFGSNPVLHMHHRATYGTDNILVGYMVSGPVKYWVAKISHAALADPQYGLDDSTPNLRSFYDKWEFYRFTETDVTRLVSATFVLGYVKGLAN